eukprot:1008982-Karenia_brevis.AAC.1
MVQRLPTFICTETTLSPCCTMYSGTSMKELRQQRTSCVYLVCVSTSLDMVRPICRFERSTRKCARFGISNGAKHLGKLSEARSTAFSSNHSELLGMLFGGRQKR